MISNLIIIVAAPFGERDYKRYGIDIIKKNNLNVFVWNLSPILYPEVYQNMKLPDPINWSNLIDIHSREQFVSELKKFNNNSFIYLTISFSLATFSIYKNISKQKIPYSVTGLNAQPIFGSLYPGTFADRLLKITPKKFFSKVLTGVPFELLGIKYASIVAVIAGKERFNRPEVSKTTPVIFTHSSDYDNYIEANSRDILMLRSIVYLDNYLPYHPDSLYSGERNPVSADIYHASLNRLFEKLERDTGLQVVIAAHPKSNYTGRLNPFNGREIIFGRTAELVKNSEIVVLNFSTSINYAILYNKPMIFFTTNELNNVLLYQRQISGLASLLDKKVLNIDEEEYEIDKSELYKINIIKYNEYKNAYIKVDGSPELHSWLIICNAIKQVQLKKN